MINDGDFKKPKAGSRKKATSTKKSADIIFNKPKAASRKKATSTKKPADIIFKKPKAGSRKKATSTKKPADIISKTSTTASRKKATSTKKPADIISKTSTAASRKKATSTKKQADIISKTSTAASRKKATSTKKQADIISKTSTAASRKKATSTKKQADIISKTSTAASRKMRRPAYKLANTVLKEPKVETTQKMKMPIDKSLGMVPKISKTKNGGIISKKYVTKRTHKWVAVSIAALALAAAATAAGIVAYYVSEGDVIKPLQVLSEKTNGGGGNTVSFNASELNGIAMINPDGDKKELQNDIVRMVQSNVFKDINANDLVDKDVTLGTAFLGQTSMLGKGIANTNNKLESLWENFIEKHFVKASISGTTVNQNLLSTTTAADRTSLDDLTDTSGPLGIISDLFIGTTANPKSFHVTGNSVLAGDLSVTGDVTVGSVITPAGLTVTAETTLDGNTQIISTAPSAGLSEKTLTIGYEGTNAASTLDDSTTIIYGNLDLRNAHVTGLAAAGVVPAVGTTAEIEIAGDISFTASSPSATINLADLGVTDQDRVNLFITLEFNPDTTTYAGAPDGWTHFQVIQIDLSSGATNFDQTFTLMVPYSLRSPDVLTGNSLAGGGTTNTGTALNFHEGGILRFEPEIRIRKVTLPNGELGLEFTGPVWAASNYGNTGNFGSAAPNQQLSASDTRDIRDKFIGTAQNAKLRTFVGKVNS